MVINYNHYKTNNIIPHISSYKISMLIRYWFVIPPSGRVIMPAIKIIDKCVNDLIIQ